MSVSGFEDPREARCGGGPVVLVVEDDRDAREALAELLQAEGFEVVTAPNGLAALQALRAGLRPSVIVLDVMMPVMDGWDFRAQQARDPALAGIPVVVMTAAGFSVPSVIQQFGRVEYLTKPLHPQSTLQTLRRLCDGRAVS